MNGKNSGIKVIVLILALVVVFGVLAWLLVFNKQDSAIKPLEPDAMHQPSTN